MLNTSQAIEWAAVRIDHDLLADRSLRANQYQSHNVNNFLGTHNIAHLAPLCIVLASIGAWDVTKGHAVVQKVSTSYCKGAHPYNYPTLNKT